MAKELESSLFDSAPDFRSYSNATTLTERLQHLAIRMFTQSQQQTYEEQQQQPDQWQRHHHTMQISPMEQHSFRHVNQLHPEESSRGNNHIRWQSNGLYSFERLNMINAM